MKISKKQNALILIPAALFLLSGCTVRHYKANKERLDQDLNIGNRGYLSGSAPESNLERKEDRTTYVTEIEFKMPRIGKKKTEAADKAMEPAGQEKSNQDYCDYTAASTGGQPVVSEQKTEQYTVQKNDTLQKIAQKYYGTTKKWQLIFEANKDKLSAPDKIYPGQIINLPVEGLKEPKENLK